MTTIAKVTKTYSIFDPRVIPNCVIWLDANDTSTITKSGSNITSWRDKSASGFNATNGASSGPTTVTTGNRTYVSFNGSSNYLQTSLTIPVNAHTILIVYKPNANNATSNSLLRAQSANYIVFPYYTSALKNAYISNYETSPGTTIDATNSPLDPVASTSTHNVVSISIASGAQAIYNNGTSKATATAVLNVGISQAFYIGAFNGTIQFYSGELAEVIIYSRTLTSTERVQLEGYLAWKWGLQGNLAVGHTYISRNPTLSYFNPSDISNCTIWLDGADKTTIDPANTASTQINTWKSKGTNVNSAGPDGAKLRFITNIDTINGLNAPRAQSTNTDMLYGSSFSNQQKSFFLVFKGLTDLTTAGLPYFNFFQRYVSNGYAFIHGYIAPNHVYAISKNASGDVVATTSGANPYNQVQLIAMVGSASSTSNNIITENGTSLTLSTSSLMSGFTISQVDYLIQQSTYSTAMNFAEMIIYDSELTTVERQRVEGYLAWKWGIASKLPSTHPFKNFYPLKIN